MSAENLIGDEKHRGSVVKRKMVLSDEPDA